MGVDIFSKTEDLCAKAACPIKAGPAVITLVEALPPIAPPVRLGVAWSGVPYCTVLKWPYTCTVGASVCQEALVSVALCAP